MTDRKDKSVSVVAKIFYIKTVHSTPKCEYRGRELPASNTWLRGSLQRLMCASFCWPKADWKTTTVGIYFVFSYSISAYRTHETSSLEVPLKAIIHFRIQSYDYNTYKELLWKQTDCDVTIEHLNVSCRFHTCSVRVWFWSDTSHLVANENHASYN